MLKPIVNITLLGLMLFLGASSCEENDGCIDKSLIDTDAVCTMDYTPVCGCDGQTYSNACVARNAGVTSYNDGECDKSE